MFLLKFRIQIYIFITISLISDSATDGRTIQCNSTKVWGLGLDPGNVVLPARYFFIESYDGNGKRLSKTPGKDVFHVKIFSPTTQPCGIRTEILDRQDGSFIVRYRTYNICNELKISVKCLGTELKNFPYHIKSTIIPEECSCSSFYNNTNEWFENLGCRNHYKQIEKDLSIFKSIDFEKIFKAAEKSLFKDSHRHSVCNYIIRENKIYRKCYGQYTGFKMFVDAILLFITRRVKMPDMEIFVNLGDWPLITKEIDVDGEKVLIPMFSWCGSKDSWDIVMPSYDITESSLKNLKSVTIDMLSVQGNTGPLWNDKIQQLFWRGRDSSRERLKLIEISRQNQSLINASLTDFFFFRDDQDKYGPKGKRVSFFSFFEFKYQLNMDGTVAAYRFPYLLVGDSLVFKQDSPYYEFFYEELTAWKEYIPVKRDLSDLIEKLKWALKHDEEAHRIAVNGQTYARENLNPHDIFCYHVKLFREYSKKQVSRDINIRPGMEMVSQPSCQCEIFPDRKSDFVKHEEL